MSSPEGTSDIDRAATELRPPFAGSNICRRGGPLKLLSKLRRQPRKANSEDAQDLTRPGPDVRRIVKRIDLVAVIIAHIVVNGCATDVITIIAIISNAIPSTI